MLQEVGTCLFRKVISHDQNSRIYGCPKLVCTLSENPLIIPWARMGVSKILIDEEGYRPNGIVVANRRGQVLWAKRVGKQDT